MVMTKINYMLLLLFETFRGKEYPALRNKNDQEKYEYKKK